MLASVQGEQASEIAAEVAPSEEVRAHQRRKPVSRNPLPDEVKRDGLVAFDRISEDTTQVLVRIIQPKFVGKDRERGAATEVFVGSTPELPIP